MKYPLNRVFALLVAALVFALPARAEALHTRDEVRSMYRSLGTAPEGTLYAEAPGVSAPYAAGALSQEALADALDYLNFLRWLAYLDAPAALDGDLTEICQHGAVLLAALDRVEHDPDRPGDMSQDFYRVAGYATASSNLAGLNWMKRDILRSALSYFARDDGEKNLAALGHRRWLLNPALGRTGFGLANSESGMSYILMFAHDLSGEASPWREICWPSRGAFPAELMRSQLAWSVSLNPEIYDLDASAPSVWMRERTSGAEYSFPYPAGSYEDGYFACNEDAYGSGPCLIFQPLLSAAGIEEYQQNQVWDVLVSGLVDRQGNEAVIEYTTEMIALQAIDPAAVEISPTALELAPGEVKALSAEVIPSWADDVSLVWKSSDEGVATVDAEGRVTAVAAGSCRIIAASANGREDACAVTVGK